MRFLEHVTLSASSAKVATFTSSVVTHANAEAVVIRIDVTAESATASVVPTVEAFDETSGTFYTILTAAAITAKWRREN